jgi:hypothetical protein
MSTYVINGDCVSYNGSSISATYIFNPQINGSQMYLDCSACLPPTTTTTTTVLDTAPTTTTTTTEASRVDVYQFQRCDDNSDIFILTSQWTGSAPQTGNILEINIGNGNECVQYITTTQVSSWNALTSIGNTYDSCMSCTSANGGTTTEQTLYYYTVEPCDGGAQLTVDTANGTLQIGDVINISGYSLNQCFQIIGTVTSPSTIDGTVTYEYADCNACQNGVPCTPCYEFTFTPQASSGSIVLQNCNQQYVEVTYNGPFNWCTCIDYDTYPPQALPSGFTIQKLGACNPQA